MKEITVIRYQCPCGKNHKTKVDAVLCEVSDCVKEYDKKRNKVFPIYYESAEKNKYGTPDKADDRYKRHCVVCGRLLLEWGCEWDGHRNNAGDLEYNYKNYSIVKKAMICDICQTSEVFTGRLNRLRDLENKHHINVKKIKSQL
jgi:hypothetical protein